MGRDSLDNELKRKLFESYSPTELALCVSARAFSTFLKTAAVNRKMPVSIMDLYAYYARLPLMTLVRLESGSVSDL